jgi:hypothetical protein
MICWAPVSSAPERVICVVVSRPASWHLEGIRQADEPKLVLAGPVPPAGDWRLVISPTGWQVYDTAGGGGFYDVVYLSAGLAEIRTGISTAWPACTPRTPGQEAAQAGHQPCEPL